MPRVRSTVLIDRISPATVLELRYPVVLPVSGCGGSKARLVLPMVESNQSSKKNASAYSHLHIRVHRESARKESAYRPSPSCDMTTRRITRSPTSQTIKKAIRTAWSKRICHSCLGILSLPNARNSALSLLAGTIVTWRKGCVNVGGRRSPRKGIGSVLERRSRSSTIGSDTMLRSRDIQFYGKKGTQDGVLIRCCTISVHFRAVSKSVF